MQDQDTALLLATYNGHTRIVLELLKRGRADTNLRDEVGIDECIGTHIRTLYISMCIHKQHDICIPQLSLTQSPNP